MPPLRRILPPIVGSLTGLAIGFFIMTTTLVTEPGYESVLKIEPPFLPGHLTGDADGPGTHRHLRFIYGIPVKVMQDFQESGATLISNDLRSMSADVSVTLRITDSAELLRVAGEDWYGQEVRMAVSASAGLAGMYFTQKDLQDADPLKRVLLDTAGASQLQKILVEKDLPLEVHQYRILKIYPQESVD